MNKKIIIPLAVLFVAAILVTGFFIYRSNAKNEAIKACDKYIHLYESDILPDKYRKDLNPESTIPEEYVNENISKTDELYNALFTQKKYSSEFSTKKEWFNGKIITGDVILTGYDVSIKETKYFKLKGLDKAEIYCVVTQKGIDKIKDGGAYVDKPFDADIGYKIILQKTEGCWKISNVQAEP